MIAVSKNVYSDKLDDIVNEYNNTYYRIINMKPVDMKYNTYIDSSKKVNDKILNFQIQNIFAKGYTPNWSGEVFMIKKVKNTVLWASVISNVKGEEITGTFYQKELQKTNQQTFRVEKAIKKKGDKLYLK